MSGKRAKNLRGHGREIIMTDNRRDLLREAMRQATDLHSRVNRDRQLQRTSQLVGIFRCAYRNVKTIYMRHRAYIGKSL